MKNREFLNQKTSSDLAVWLEEEHQEQQIQKTGTDWTMFPNFKPSEFVCRCGKCEWSKAENVQDIDPKLLWILQAIRNKFGISVDITCGVRCQEYNDSLPGSEKDSKHLAKYKRAADFKITGKTNTESGREEVLAFAKKLPGYKYGYHNKGGKYPNMGVAVHINV